MGLWVLMSMNGLSDLIHDIYSYKTEFWKYLTLQDEVIVEKSQSTLKSRYTNGDTEFAFHRYSYLSLLFFKVG